MTDPTAGVDTSSLLASSRISAIAAVRLGRNFGFDYRTTNQGFNISLTNCRKNILRIIGLFLVLNFSDSANRLFAQFSFYFFFQGKYQRRIYSSLVEHAKK